MKFIIKLRLNIFTGKVNGYTVFNSDWTGQKRIGWPRAIFSKRIDAENWITKQIAI